ncbi:tyrosine-protein phosphatase [Microbacterium sp. LWH7-1.2]|uniref:tyrosine-protein phosphatase n=1 Tax=Microbacterium sp. LWH7-1.2 TaxID=3135257 RepID=UPI0031399095
MTDDPPSVDPVDPSDPARPGRLAFSDPVVPGAVNLRDVGGLRAGATTTRYGVLFRSGNLARLGAKGGRALAGLGLRRIIDLRADDEVARDPSRTAGMDVVTQRVPLFLGSVDSFFRDDLSLDEMYRLIVDESSDNVVAVVRGILADQPVLVHCTAGKDRTGVTVALTLAAAGVDADEVIADYARTEALLPARRNRYVVALIRSMHPRAVNVEDLVARSPAPVMHALLADVDERYGSAAEYLRTHGLADDEIVELRRVLLQRDA